MEPGTLAVGDVLDEKYEVLRVLGQGAMGVVYIATHRRLGRTVALKTLRAEIASEPELLERFEREARAASAIGHPNIVQIYDAGGRPGGVQYIVMEHLRGESLGDLLQREHALSVDRALLLVDQVLSGLQAAHQVGIVHRDLKPDNLFIVEEEGGEVAKILDFGISKVLAAADPAIAGAASATRAGAVLGTPLYMSPEQARGRADVDHRCDLWAAGCVLYECLCGRTPFAGENYNQILAAILLGRFSSPLELRREIAPGVEALLQRALNPAIESRFQSAAEMQTALRACSGVFAQPAPEDGAFAPPSTGTLLADASEEDALLEAFDGLAVKMREQELFDSAELSSPSPSPVTTPAAPPEPEPGRPGDAFGPPDAETEMALDLAEPLPVVPDAPRRAERSERRTP